MAIQKEALRVKAGQSLTDFQNQAISSISQLQMIKTNLFSLRDIMVGDTINFSSDDIQELDVIVADLATRIQVIIS